MAKKRSSNLLSSLASAVVETAKKASSTVHDVAESAVEKVGSVTGLGGKPVKKSAPAKSAKAAPKPKATAKRDAKSAKKSAKSAVSSAKTSVKKAASSVKKSVKKTSNAAAKKVSGAKKKAKR